MKKIFLIVLIISVFANAAFDPTQFIESQNFAVQAEILGDQFADTQVLEDDILDFTNSQIRQADIRDTYDVIYGMGRDGSDGTKILKYSYINSFTESKSGEQRLDTVIFGNNFKHLIFPDFSINTSERNTNEVYYPLFNDEIFFFSRPFSHKTSTSSFPSQDEVKSSELLSKWNSLEQRAQARINEGYVEDEELIQNVSQLLDEIDEVTRVTPIHNLNLPLNRKLYASAKLVDPHIIADWAFQTYNESGRDFDNLFAKYVRITIDRLDYYPPVKENPDDPNEPIIQLATQVINQLSTATAGNQFPGVGTVTHKPEFYTGSELINEYLSNNLITTAIPNIPEFQLNATAFRPGIIESLDPQINKFGLGRIASSAADANLFVTELSPNARNPVGTLYQMSNNLFCDFESFNIDYYDSNFCTLDITNNGCQPQDETWSYSEQGEAGSGFCCGNSLIDHNGYKYLADLGLARANNVPELCRSLENNYLFEEVEEDAIYDFTAPKSDFESTIVKVDNVYYACKSDTQKALDSQSNPSGFIEQEFRYDRIIDIDDPQRTGQILCNNKTFLRSYHQECTGFEQTSIKENPQLQANKGKFYISPGQGLGDTALTRTSSGIATSKHTFRLNNSDFIDTNQIIVEFDITSNYVEKFNLTLHAYSRESKSKEKTTRISQEIDPNYYPKKNIRFSKLLDVSNFSGISITCQIGSVQSTTCTIDNVKIYPSTLNFSVDSFICSNERDFISFDQMQELNEDTKAPSSTVCEQYSPMFKYIKNGTDVISGSIDRCCTTNSDDNIIGSNGACIYGNFIPDSINSANLQEDYKSTMFLVNSLNKSKENEQNQYMVNKYVDTVATNNPKGSFQIYSNPDIYFISGNYTRSNYNYSNYTANGPTLFMKRYYPNVAYNNQTIYGCAIANGTEDLETDFSSNFVNKNKIQLFPPLNSQGTALKYADDAICGQVGKLFCSLDGTYKPANTNQLAFHEFIENRESFVGEYDINELVMAPIDVFNYDYVDTNIPEYFDTTRDKLDNLQDLACCPTNSCFDGNECIENQVQFPSLQAKYSNYKNDQKSEEYARDTSMNGLPYLFNTESNSISKLCVGKFSETKYDQEYGEGLADGWVNATNQTDWTGNYFGHCLPRHCYMPEFLVEGDDYITISNENVLSDHKYQTGVDFDQSPFRKSVQNQRFLCVEPDYFTGDHLCGFEGTTGKWTTRTSVIYDQLLNWTTEKTNDMSDWEYLVHCDSDLFTNELDLDMGQACMLRLTSQINQELIDVNQADMLIGIAINKPGDVENFANYLDVLNARDTNNCIDVYSTKSENRTIDCGEFTRKGATFDILLDNKYKILYLSKGFEFERELDIDIFLLTDIVNLIASAFGFNNEVVINMNEKASTFTFDRIFETKNSLNKEFRVIEKHDKAFFNDDVLIKQGGEADKSLIVNININDGLLAEQYIKNIENKMENVFNNDDFTRSLNKTSNEFEIKISNIADISEWNAVNKGMEQVFKQIIDGIRLQ